MMTPGIEELPEYCRQIESYLCRKNGGHLVRIVGPAFETVRSWASQGVPLKVAFQGIDRCVERANARAGRRRPLRIEFCEADVLEAFDAWRRAIGAGGSRVSEEGATSEEWGSPGRKGSLAAHVERSLSRLLVVKVGPDHRGFDEVIARVTTELDRVAETAKSARGDARALSIARLAELDAELIQAARATISDGTAAALQREADAELGAFAARMPAESIERARALTFDRLLRESLNLPVLSYE
jgi:hypothetical protein